METIQDIRVQLENIVTAAHRVACSLDIGEERTEAFELYEALRRLQRRGAASEMLAATNPLLNFPCVDDEDDEDWDEDD
ncbi:hypothetical protein E0L21_18950 [Kosakonia quasisacchari]|uniref:Toluene hydroxylase n=1 Tax=Kosakonia quasisacchari TaxID=2529380 RepID=A0A4R0GWV3_9ENTR|nr:hypothetical protein [Kosakonia quasisacchari]TCC01244.1 hypothetical protein E0L21_18950 [Kosakonia quasisacchari]